MTLLHIVLIALVIVGCLLNINKRPLCFAVWTIANFGYIGICIGKGEPLMAVPWIIYTALNAYGAYKWTKNR